MNNEQNNNTSLTEMFGTETNESVSQVNNQQQQKEIPQPEPQIEKQEDTTVVPQPEIPTQPETPQQPIQQPQIPVYDPQPPKKEEEPPKNNQDNLQKNNSSIVIIMLVLIVGVLGFYFISGANKKVDLNGQTSSQNTEGETTKSDDKKATMIKMITGYTKKMEPYLTKKEFSCNDDALIKPTTFYIEIDTTEGESVAQKNAKLLNVSKSPWNNDIKGYIRVERQVTEEFEYSVKISDNNYGVAKLTKLSDLTERSIKENIAYSEAPEKIRCLLGKTE